jgi:hypothetical protein
MEEQVLPEGLDAHRIASEQAGRKVIVQQGKHRRTARADRVRVTGAGLPFVVDDGDERRLLPHERLDRIRAHHLRFQVDLAQFDAPDPAHGRLSCGGRGGSRPRVPGLLFGGGEVSMKLV